MNGMGARLVYKSGEKSEKSGVRSEKPDVSAEKSNERPRPNARLIKLFESIFNGISFGMP